MKKDRNTLRLNCLEALKDLNPVVREAAEIALRNLPQQPETFAVLSQPKEPNDDPENV